MTVTGTARPSSVYTCVMPTFLPMIPWTDMRLPLCSRQSTVDRRQFALLGVLLAESLDLHVHAGGEVQLHEGVDGLRARLEDVQQPLVGADLELLAALLVHVRRAQHRPAVLHG